MLHIRLALLSLEPKLSPSKEVIQRLMNETKSPIKAPLLRSAGQSLDEKINGIIDDQVFELVFTPIFLGLLAGFQWLEWSLDLSISPWWFTLGCLASALYSYFKIKGVRARLASLKQGREGERAVGQYLETITDAECKLFHDVVAEDFNIDHIIISTKGVFAIETKTYSKPSRGEAIIRHNGDGLYMNKSQFESRDELVQVKAAANWVRKFYEKHLDRRLQVKPVLLFPGWYIKNEGNQDVWVLEPKAFPKYLENAEVIFDKDEVNTLSNALSRFIRDSVRFD